MGCLRDVIRGKWTFVFVFKKLIAVTEEGSGGR